MKYLGSFIFPPAVIQRVLTTRLLLGTGLSKYPRLSGVPIAVWTYTCGYLSSGAPAPGTVWEVCACVSGVVPVSVPGCRRVPVTQCVTRTVCPRERRGGEGGRRGLGPPCSLPRPCSTFSPRTQGGAAASLSAWPGAPGPASRSSRLPRALAWEGFPVPPSGLPPTPLLRQSAWGGRGEGA